MKRIQQQTDTAGITYVTEFDDASTAPCGSYAIDAFGNLLWSWRKPVIVETKIIVQKTPIITVTGFAR